MKKSLSVLMSVLIIVNGSNLLTNVIASDHDASQEQEQLKKAAEEDQKQLKAVEEQQKQSQKAVAEKKKQEQACKKKEVDEKADEKKVEEETKQKKLQEKLVQAVKNDDFEVVKKCLDDRANIDDLSVAHMVQIGGSTEDESVICYETETPIVEYAIEYSNVDIAKSLLARVNREKALELCRIAIQNAKVELIKYIMDLFNLKCDKNLAIDALRSQNTEILKIISKQEYIIDDFEVLAEALETSEGIDFALTTFQPEKATDDLKIAIQNDKELLLGIVKAERLNPQGVELFDRILKFFNTRREVCLELMDLAINNNCVNVLKRLIDKCSVIQCSDYEALIAQAIEKGNVEVLSLILDKCSSKVDYESLLSDAISKGQHRQDVAVELLKRAGESIKNPTELFDLAWKSKSSLVLCNLANRVSKEKVSEILNKKDENGNTLLHNAIHNWSILAAIHNLRSFIEDGTIDVNAQDSCGMTPIHLLFDSMYKNGHYFQKADEALVKLLVDRCDVSIKDNYGNTVLHYAAKCGCTSLLIGKDGLNWNEKNNEDETPLRGLLSISSTKRAIFIENFLNDARDNIDIEDRYQFLKSVLNADVHSEFTRYLQRFLSIILKSNELNLLRVAVEKNDRELIEMCMDAFVKVEVEQNHKSLTDVYISFINYARANNNKIYLEIILSKAKSESKLNFNEILKYIVNKLSSDMIKDLLRGVKFSIKDLIQMQALAIEDLEIVRILAERVIEVIPGKK